jgi:hypothetical protein
MSKYFKGLMKKDGGKADPKAQEKPKQNQKETPQPQNTLVRVNIFKNSFLQNKHLLISIAIRS